MQVIANGIGIEVEDSGGAGPVVLLVMGLGMQLIAWPTALVQGLQAAGYRVLRFDNRDVGLSQGFDDAPPRSFPLELARGRMGLPIRAAYSLQDMADDARGVLDALSIQQAHVVGVSMGGMIAQRLAISAPGRVSTLTSIMSSSGAVGLPWPRPDVVMALMRRPPGSGEEAYVEHVLGFMRRVSSPGYPFDEAGTRDQIRRGYRRAHRPQGVLRQMLAVAADEGLRAPLLQKISCPTLVLHGQDDPFVPVACGRDTAARIAGARFEALPGMAHDLPAGVIGAILAELLPLLDAVSMPAATRHPG